MPTLSGQRETPVCPNGVSKHVDVEKVSAESDDVTADLTGTEYIGEAGAMLTGEDGVALFGDVRTDNTDDVETITLGADGADTFGAASLNITGVIDKGAAGHSDMSTGEAGTMLTVDDTRNVSETNASTPEEPIALRTSMLATSTRMTADLSGTEYIGEAGAMLTGDIGAAMLGDVRTDNTDDAELTTLGEDGAATLGAVSLNIPGVVDKDIPGFADIKSTGEAGTRFIGDDDFTPFGTARIADTDKLVAASPSIGSTVTSGALSTALSVFAATVSVSDADIDSLHDDTEACNVSVANASTLEEPNVLRTSMLATSPQRTAPLSEQRPR